MGARAQAATPPGWRFERRLYRQGFVAPAGLDEVGRGSLAGPVVAAAVILRPGARLKGVNDSKLLAPGRRRDLLRAILRGSLAWGIGASDALEIDRINILNATLLAMRRATDNLPIRPDHLLLDAVRLSDLSVPQTPLVHGDRRCLSIAAASILAKVARDRVMELYDRIHPGYGFAGHKGYATALHRAAIAHRGASPIHRLTFAGVLPQRGLPFQSRAAGERRAPAPPA